MVTNFPSPSRGFLVATPGDSLSSHLAIRFEVLGEKSADALLIENSGEFRREDVSKCVEAFQRQIDDSNVFLPAGVRVVGVFAKGISVMPLVPLFVKLFGEEPVALQIDEGNLMSQVHGPPVPASSEDKRILRTKTQFEVDIFDADAVDIVSSRIESEDVHFVTADRAFFNSKSEGTISDLFGQAAGAASSQKSGKGAAAKSHSSTPSSRMVELKPYWVEKSSAEDGSVTMSFTTEKAPRRQIISLDVVFCGYESSTQAAAATSICQKLATQFRHMAKLLSADPRPCKVFHFSTVAQPLSLVVQTDTEKPTEDQDNELLPLRTRLHSKLGLLPRPYFRLSQTTNFTETCAVRDTDRLANVHIGLDMSSKVNGTVYLVSGNYQYYHYMQDSFNDDGWGCAYRSCQTLVSWFRCQHYTSVPVPSHRQIQTTLVKLGIRTSEIIGSKQWIGATEVGNFLDAAMGVKHRILGVNPGADVAQHGRALASHFQECGAPVSIGGGVLAYTLLGIDWNEHTGEIRLLILDPHYKGADTLSSIQGKGWVAWHPVTLLKTETNFYNFCCPILPQEI